MPASLVNSDIKKINEYFTQASPHMTVIKIEPADSATCSMGRVYKVYVQEKEEAIALAVGKDDIFIAPT